MVQLCRRCSSSPHHQKCSPPKHYSIFPSRPPRFVLPVARCWFTGGTLLPWLPLARCFAVHSSYSFSRVVWQEAAAQARGEPGRCKQRNHGHGADTFQIPTNAYIAFLLFLPSFTLHPIPERLKKYVHLLPPLLHTRYPVVYIRSAHASFTTAKKKLRQCLVYSPGFPFACCIWPRCVEQRVSYYVRPPGGGTELFTLLLSFSRAHFHC